ncbi:MAG TPA: serine hydrolase [Bryobacteraceae bacterium]|nr:serine hydrolase [Bryobacteraceae bacterium]
MHLFVLFLASLAALSAETVAKAKTSPAVDSAVASCPGTVSFYAKNLESGTVLGRNEDERVRTASTIKLPIMAATFAAIADGKGQWTDTVTMTGEDKVSGTGVIRELSAGTKLPIRDLVHMMIVVSDNTATNLVLDRFNADLVNSYLVKFGMQQTKALRKILGDGRNLKPTPTGQSKEGLTEEYRKYGIGVSTPREMGVLLEKLERGEIVSPEASKEMIAILKRQQDNAGMQRLLPYPIASKAGALEKLRADVGIVYTPTGRIVLAMTVDDLPSAGYKPDNPGLLCLANLAKALVADLSPKKAD